MPEASAEGADCAGRRPRARREGRRRQLPAGRASGSVTDSTRAAAPAVTYGLQPSFPVTAVLWGPAVAAPASRSRLTLGMAHLPTTPQASVSIDIGNNKSRAFGFLNVTAKLVYTA